MRAGLGTFRDGERPGPVNHRLNRGSLRDRRSRARLRVRAVPVESFTLVMATGIVAVAARYNGQAVSTLALAVLAGAGLALIIVWVAVARIRTAEAPPAAGTGWIGRHRRRGPLSADTHHRASMSTSSMGTSLPSGRRQT